MEKQSSLDGYRLAGILFLLIVLAAICYYGLGGERITTQASSIYNQSELLVNDSYEAFTSMFANEESNQVSVLGDSLASQSSIESVETTELNTQTLEAVKDEG